MQYRVPEPHYADRWTGGEVYLVGDYGCSRLYQTAKDSY